MWKKLLLKTVVVFSVCFFMFFITDAFAARALKITKEEAYSEQRIALVIGNSSYKTSPLKNPANDATDMAKKLESLGFQVTRLLNSTQADMRKAIRQFGKDLKKGGVGLFFFAGHGMQVQGVNYLIPVGAEINEEEDVLDLGIDANLVLRAMQSADNRLNIVILDACRNNPFARSYRSGVKGLAQMDAPAGSMIAYATAPGMTASDGDGRNGVFTKNFLRALDQNSSLELSGFFKQVAKGVQTDTGKGQIPWISSSITGDFYFGLRPSTEKKAATVATETVTNVKKQNIDEEEEMWLAIKSSNSVEDFKDYIKIYPTGRFKKIAEIKLRQLTEETKKPVEKKVVVAPVVSDDGGDRILYYDTFGSNDNGWRMWPDGPYYLTSISGGSFIFETKNELNSSEFTGRSIAFPENFEIEVTTTWKRGVDDRAYGIALGIDGPNRYNFGVSGNGWSFVSGYDNNKVIDPSPMPWKQGTAKIGNGYISNVLKIKAFGSRCDFYVNDIFVGTVTIPISHDRLKVGFFVENKQQVYFNNLKVTAKGSGDGGYGGGTVIFTDNFSYNANSWSMWPKSDLYTTAIESGSYVMETKNTLNSAEFPGKFVTLPENFDIEVSSTWKKGVNNYSYGLTMGTDHPNRYNFGLSGNGWTFISGYSNNNVIDPAPMPWKSGTSVISTGYNQNLIKVKVRGTKFDYYVNGLFIGTVYITLPRDKMRFGFFVENMQQIQFNNLKVTAY